jgi:hypothetical protein
VFSQFLNYGHCRREDPVEKNHEKRDDVAWQQKIMYPGDIKEAARLLQQFQPFGLKPWPKESTAAALREHIAKELSLSPTKLTKFADPEFILSILIKVGNSEDRKNLYEAVNEISFQSKESQVRIMGHDLVSKKDSYESIAKKRLWFELAKISLERKDPEWIQQNGLCLEHLLPKKSTLPHAGFGGFAQYGIDKNEIVVPAPVLHVTYKETLNLYRRGIVGDEIHSIREDPASFKTGISLLLNYCFGHSQSSMLMCPMTSAMLINHCSNRSKECGPKGPNAKVRWSSGWDPESHRWRNRTLDEIDHNDGRILSLEIVALRDIAPDEEGSLSQRMHITIVLLV